MKVIINILFVWAFVFAVGQSSYCGEAGTFTTAIEQAKRLVVPIVCFGKDPDTKSPYLISVEGTGFFVAGDPRVITAGHVGKGINQKSRIPACPIAAIYLPEDGWNSSNLDVKIRYIPIAECLLGDNLDIAICKLVGDPITDAEIRVKPTSSELDSTIYPDGTPIAFIGFPLSFVQPITSQGIIGTYRNPIKDFGPTELVIDKNAWPGASGSPVFDSTAHVVGMIILRGFSDASGLAFAIPGGVLKRFLADHPPSKEEKHQ